MDCKIFDITEMQHKKIDEIRNIKRLLIKLLELRVNLNLLASDKTVVKLTDDINLAVKLLNQKIGTR